VLPQHQRHVLHFEAVACHTKSDRRKGLRSPGERLADPAPKTGELLKAHVFFPEAKDLARQVLAEEAEALETKKEK